MRPLFLLLALVLPVVASSAKAESMSTGQVADIFCIARLSGDMAPVLAILTPELGALIDAHSPAGSDSATSIPWQSKPDYANTCQAVGAQGSGAAPIAVLAYGYREADKPGYADGIVLRFIEGRLRIDDINFGVGGGTLRQRLEALP